MSYADDTEYAVRNLIELSVREEQDLEEKMQLLLGAEQRLKSHQWDFQTSDLNDDFSDAYVMAAFARAAKAGQEVNALKGEVARLQALIGARQISVQAISGAILQIAKQGVSLANGGLANAPSGRQIGTTCVRDIVWLARNQAIHYEEGNYRQPVLELFQSLEEAYGAVFSLQLHARQSRAKQVVDLLGWNSYAAYLADARLLGL